MTDCDFCRNAFTDGDLSHDNDLSYSPIGAVEPSYRAFLRTGDRRKTAIMVEYGSELAFIYAPKYCPECGRHLLENERCK